MFDFICFVCSFMFFVVLLVSVCVVVFFWMLLCCYLNMLFVVHRRDFNCYCDFAVSSFMAVCL